MDSCVIVGCSSLEDYIRAAQAAAGSCWPVLLLDRSLHAEPPAMRRALLEALHGLPAGSTVLAAMGFCGGSWEKVRCPCRVVLPRKDDCISLLLHTRERRGVDLKEAGHFYLVNPRRSEQSPAQILEGLRWKYGDENAALIFREWFRNYVSLDVADTGLNPCWEPEYVAMAEENAALIGCSWQYVPGSNLMLEKLCAGHWDEDFLIYAPGEIIRAEDLLPPEAPYFSYSP